MSVAPDCSARAGCPADTLDEFMLAAARSTPDKPAVVEPNAGGGLAVVSYCELEQRVNDYTEPLAGLGLDVGDRVVVESHTSAPAIVMLLACSRIGAAFIPVSPDTPDLRLQSIIEATDPVLHVRASGGIRRELPQAVPTAHFGASGLVVEGRPAPRNRHRRAAVGTDTAYIIFTSGTTGRPKGVVMSHHAALAFYRGALRFGVVCGEDRVATTAPLQFDVSLFDISITLGCGATVVPVPRELLSFPRRLLGFLRETQVTTVHAVPSLWRPLLRHEAGGIAQLDHLRGIMFTGENFPLPELRHLQRLLPGRRIINAFGATETVAFSFADVPNPLPENRARLSIGHGYPGGEMFLVDENGKPVDTPGEVGEIYVRGPSMFTGYWDDPAATREVLVADPLNPRSGQIVYRSGDLAYRGEQGELYFCGRADSMVKIRGNRIELGEIERQLLEYPGVRAAIAVAAPSADGELSLSAFVVFSPEVTDTDPAHLIDQCKRTLPAYMIPRKIHVLKELPLTTNGKINRLALTELGTDDR